MKPKVLTPEEFVEICYNFVKEEMKYDEPIPEITEEGLNKIGYCLTKPALEISNKLLFNTIAEQTMALCFCICKQHCFINGNKRLALITTFLFLFKNGYILRTKKPLLYLITNGIVNIPPSRSRDDLIKRGLIEFFESSIEKFDITTLIGKKLF